MCGGGLTPAQCRSGHGAAYTVHSYTLSVKTWPGKADYYIYCDTNILHVLKRPSDSAVSWISIVDKYLYI